MISEAKFTTGDSQMGLQLSHKTCHITLMHLIHLLIRCLRNRDRDPHILYFCWWNVDYKSDFKWCQRDYECSDKVWKTWHYEKMYLTLTWYSYYLVFAFHEIVCISHRAYVLAYSVYQMLQIRKESHLVCKTRSNPVLLMYALLKFLFHAVHEYRNNLRILAKPSFPELGPALLTLKSFYLKAFSRKHGCDWLMLKHQPITATLSAKSF